MSGVDFRKLSDASDPEFLHNIRVAYLSVTKDDLEEYFTILGNHFTHPLHTKHALEIIAAITAVMPLEGSGEKFEHSGIIRFLPIGLPQFAARILDLLCFVVQKSPKIFDDQQIVANFSQYCDNFPEKTLTIIAIFGQQFALVEEPLNMLDVLFFKSECFTTQECADNYVSLLLWLLKNCEEFRKERLQHTWSYLCDMLKSKSPTVINAAYRGLCASCEINPELIQTFGYPREAVAFHIQHKATQQATLSLLLRYTPLPTAKYVDQIVIALLNLATKNEDATLLLLELATDENISEILLDNPSWMCKGLPNVLDTLKLFGVVMLHVNLRSKIVQLSETIGFFTMLLQVNSIGVCNAVCTFMKKLSPTPDFVTLLSTSGFLAGYFGMSYEIDDPSVKLSALRLIDILAKVKFVPEFMDMIPFVVDLCKSGDDLALPATIVISKLSRFPRCAKELRALHLDEFFQQPINDPRIKKYGNKIIPNILKC